MSGPQHYQAAERLLLSAEAVEDGVASRTLLMAAQVSAQLAQAAATVLSVAAVEGLVPGETRDWEEVGVL